jgi:hypothetical protein
MLHDLRIAWSGLRRSPGYLIAAAGTLALGIGASTAVFSVFHAAMLKPLPHAAPGRLAQMWEEAMRMGIPENTPAPANYFDWKA